MDKNNPGSFFQTVIKKKVRLLELVVSTVPLPNKHHCLCGKQAPLKSNHLKMWLGISLHEVLTQDMRYSHFRNISSSRELTNFKKV